MIFVKLWFVTETDGSAKDLDIVCADTFGSWDVDEEEENDEEEEEEKGNEGATLKNVNFLEREPSGGDVT